MTVSTIPSKTGIYAIGLYTWAGKPPISAVPSGTVIRISDVGLAPGALFVSNGTVWRPEHGIVTLKTLGDATAPIANSETIVMQTLLPAGLVAVNGMIRLRFGMTKSGGTDLGRLTVRFGTAGTTSDTAITGLSARNVLNATHLAGGWDFDIKLVSATSALAVGCSAASSSAYVGGSTGAISAATTITDASANALYVSVGIASSSTNDTVSMQSGSLQLVAA